MYMDMMRLFVVWLLVLLAYVVINPPSGKARIVSTSEISKPAEVNQEYLLKRNIKIDNRDPHSPLTSLKKTLIK